MPIEVVGLNETIKDCQEAPELIKELLLPAMEASLLSLLPDLADYPPARPTSDRKGILAKFWTTAKPEFTSLASGFEGSVGNKLHYAPFVQGSPQARPFRGWWNEAEKVLQKHKPDIEARLQAAIEDINLELGR